MKQTNIVWATKTFILSISLSIFFSVFSQGLFPKLPAFLSILIIMLFVVVSVVFDMIGIAAATLNIENFEKYRSKKGFLTTIRISESRDKVSSFCGDVVGDICSILSGAGGVSLVYNLQIADPNVYFIVTCLISSLIAGLTIFGKAIMKGYAVENSEKIIFSISKILETNPFKLFFKK